MTTAAVGVLAATGSGGAHAAGLAPAGRAYGPEAPLPARLADARSPLGQTSLLRTGTLHTGGIRTGVVHTGVVHTGVVHTGVVHTGTVHTGTVHTGTVHTGTVHTGTVHTGSVHTRAAAACPVTTNGGDSANDPYQLAFTGTLAGTLQITTTPAGPINLPNIGGTFCGLLELPNETASVQPANLAINPVQVGLARATVPATVIATSISTGTVAITPAANGGLEVTLTVPAAAQTGLLGVSCILPTSLDLSTAVPGGSPLVGPLRTGAQATLTQTGFTVGDAESTGATGTCPSYLASQVDSLLALPNDHTTTTVAITLTLPIP